MQRIIFVDLPKVSTNEIYAGVHWSRRKKLKEDFLWLTLNAIKKLIPAQEKVDLDFTFHFKKNALDADNCGYMGKLIIDCLVAHGMLKDDSNKFVGRVSYESKKSDNDFCELVISSSCRNSF